MRRWAAGRTETSPARWGIPDHRLDGSARLGPAHAGRAHREDSLIRARPLPPACSWNWPDRPGLRPARGAAHFHAAAHALPPPEHVSPTQDVTHRPQRPSRRSRVSVDPRGIAHIRAENRDDLFFAQAGTPPGTGCGRSIWRASAGFDCWRRTLVPAIWNRTAPRAFVSLPRRHGGGNGRLYAPDAQAICTAFAAGINAYVDGVLAGDLPLPPEFCASRLCPAHWPGDVVRVRSHSLTRNATSELLRARVVGADGAPGGAALDLLRKDIEPFVVPAVPEGWIWPVLGTGCCGISCWRSRRSALPATGWRAPLCGCAALVAADAFGRVDRIASAEGSNNWHLARRVRPHGRAILCLDPHRTHVLPSVRYIVHLSMPGFDAIGAGEPMVPGISMGHNGERRLWPDHLWRRSGRYPRL